MDYIEGQDIMAWVSQGPVADRVNEKITKSDVGVIACRRMFKEAVEAVRNGEDPIAVVREPHDAIKLPLERSKFGRGAQFATDWINDGSMRYSPIADELKHLHIDAAAARDELAAVLMTIDHAHWAAYLLAGVDERREVQAITKQVDDLSVDDAYAIQAALLELQLGRGDTLAGAKLGLTSAAKQEQMGVSEPVYGWVPASSVLDAGQPVRSAS